MTATAENQNGIKREVRRLASLGNGFVLDGDYAAEIGKTLLRECGDLVAASSVVDELLSRDSLPKPNDIRALAWKLRPRGNNPWDSCPFCSDPHQNRHAEGWLHFDKEINGVPYSFVRACSCRAGGGR